MSTADNVAIVRRWYEDLWNRWRLDVADEIVDPTISFRGSLGVDLHGVRALKDYVEHVRSAFPDFHNHIEEVVAQDDRVVARLTYTGTHEGSILGFAPSGRRIRYVGVAIFRLRNGKIVHGWVLGDVFGLREQLSGGAAHSPTSAAQQPLGRPVAR